MRHYQLGTLEDRDKWAVALILARHLYCFFLLRARL